MLFDENVFMVVQYMNFQNKTKDGLATILKHNGTEARNEQQCLINLEELNGTNPNNDQVAIEIDGNESQLSSNNPFRADDTFTQLATREQSKKPTENKLLVIPPSNHHSTLDDSGEFAVPASANSEDINKSFKFPLTGEFSKVGNDDIVDPTLPTPVEVISITENDKDLSKSISAEVVDPALNISGDHSLNPFLNKEDGIKESGNSDVNTPLNNFNVNHSKQSAQSSVNLGAIHSHDNETLNPLLPARSEPQIPKQSMANQIPKKKIDNIVNMDLVDSSFTPYKKKSVSNGHIIQQNGEGTVEEALPKMKIFLPKQNDDEDTDDGDSSLSSENENTHLSNV